MRRLESAGAYQVSNHSDQQLWKVKKENRVELFWPSSGMLWPSKRTETRPPQSESESEGMGEEARDGQPQALVIPHALQGHINPAVLLCRNLASSSHGFFVTLLLTQRYACSGGLNPSSVGPGVRIVGLPDGLPAEHPRKSDFRDAYEAILGLREAAQLFIQRTLDSGVRFACIIADSFVSWSHDVAESFGIPRVIFITTNASAFHAMASTQMLINTGIIPFKCIKGKLEDEPITCIPGLIPLRPKDFPESMLSTTLSSYRLQFLVKQFEHIDKSIGVLVNTVYELESNVIDEIQKDFPVYAVGPLLLTNGEDGEGGGGGFPSFGISLWQEESDCLQWLDNQIEASVLYVSFGSMTLLSLEQIWEIALGLEASELPFLWVVRPDSVDGGTLSDALPQGFLDRIRGGERGLSRGLIISWAPQISVLSHRAVGGFVTHCGWNSVFENISLGGVPMICWPQGAEQRINTRLIVDHWNIGIDLTSGDDPIICKDEVERVARVVLQTEVGTDMRNRLVSMKTVVKRARHIGGSSVKNLESFLEKLLKAAKM